MTMGCGDECPLVLAKQRVEWQIPDPKEMPPDAVPRGPRPDRVEGQGTADLARRAKGVRHETHRNRTRPPAPAESGPKTTERVRAIPDRVGRAVHGRRRPPGPHSAGIDREPAGAGVRGGEPDQRPHRRADLADDRADDDEDRLLVTGRGRPASRRGCWSRCSSTGWSSHSACSPWAGCSSRCCSCR